ncbi:MAG TPA: hypothetical protein VMM79_19245, partial [Longimicrobiales bacterium]|nr:hypothetical protein [Longimicrobiales bacterium]
MAETRMDPSQETRSRPAPRWHRWAVPGLLMVHGLACWLARPIGYLTGQDDIEYLALAQTLRQGSYHFLFRADAP